MDNIDPKVWGNAGWTFLHSVTLSYSDKPSKDEKNTMRTFLTIIRDILPCAKCRKNYSKHMTKYDLEEGLKSKDDLVRWMLNIRNASNKEIGKPILSVKDMINELKKKNNVKKKSNACKNGLITALLIIITIFISLYLYYRNN